MLLVGLSCKDKHESCEHDYLSHVEVAGLAPQNVFYNASNRIQAIISPVTMATPVVRADFVYQNDQLVRVTNVVGPDVSVYTFRYDSASHLLSTTVTYRGVQIDSTGYKYNSSGQLTSRRKYTGSAPFDQPVALYILSYPTSSSVQVKAYDVELTGQPILASTTVYTLDDHKRPWPDEYYIYQSASGFVFSSNVVQQDITPASGEPSSLSSEYQFNSNGSPLSASGLTSATYDYSCTPPKE